jgi:hypothetical protein
MSTVYHGLHNAYHFRFFALALTFLQCSILVCLLSAAPGFSWRSRLACKSSDGTSPLFIPIKPFSSIGLAPLIAHMGFPAPVILLSGLRSTNQLVAVLIGCGLFTRVVAISAALGMLGALCASLRVREDWLRGRALFDCLRHFVADQSG